MARISITDMKDTLRFHHERTWIVFFTHLRCVCRVSIKESSVAKLGSVCRRIYRIFSHAYFHHRQIFDKYEVGLFWIIFMGASMNCWMQRYLTECFSVTRGCFFLPLCHQCFGAFYQAFVRHTKLQESCWVCIFAACLDLWAALAFLLQTFQAQNQVVV